MTIETVISIGIMVLLTYTIWRLNRKSSPYKSKVNLVKAPNQNKRSTQINQYLQGNAINQTSELEASTSEFELPTDFLNLSLITSEKLDDNQQKVVKEISQSFRKPHPLLLPLTQGGFEPNELFDLIKTDAEMTAKILNVVNSPLFSLRQSITNINHAIIFLGISQVKNIALQLAVQNNLKFTDDAQSKAYKKLWAASYLASSFCLLLAKEVNEENAAELSTHCLLSYLGDLAILSYKPSIAGFYLDDYGLFERTKVFQKTLNINTAVIGTTLAQQWRLPSTIVNGIDNSLLSLTNSATESVGSSEQLRHILLCYISCRLADLVAFGDLRDCSELNVLSFEALGEVEFYYTQAQIRNAGLDKINALVIDTNFRKKMNRIIEQTY